MKESKINYKIWRREYFKLGRLLKKVLPVFGVKSDYLLFILIILSPSYPANRSRKDLK